MVVGSSSLKFQSLEFKVCPRSSLTQLYTQFSQRRKGGKFYFIGAMGGVAFVTIGAALPGVPGVLAAEMEFSVVRVVLCVQGWWPWLHLASFSVTL